jgi:hypothetical protein
MQMMELAGHHLIVMIGGDQLHIRKNSGEDCEQVDFFVWLLI